MPAPRRRLTTALLIASSFAALWGGGVAALADWLIRDARIGASAAIFITGVVAALGALIALSLARRWGEGLLHSLREAVRRSDLADGAIRTGVSGWQPFDALVAECDRLVRMRTLRINALTRAEARFRALADSTHSVEAWFSPTGALVWINRSIESLTGYTRADCLLAANLIELLVPPKDRSQMLALGRAALRGESRSDFELRIVTKEGSQRWIACHWQAMRDVRRRLLGVRLSVEDIQPRKDAEARLLDTVSSLRRAQALQQHYLQRSEDERLRLTALLDTLRVGILFVDRDGRVYYCNRRLREMWGFGHEENLNGLRDETLIERTAQMRCDDAAYRAHVSAVISRRPASSVYEIQCIDGRVLEEVSALVATEDGLRRIGRVWIYEDVTERLETSRRLVELAERDALTGLFNRRRFHEELARMAAESERQGKHLGVLALDLDGFKAVNDNFGHAAGDRVLIDVASRVLATVRRNEMLFRLGGDEFALLVPEADLTQLETLARRINERIGMEPFSFEGGQAQVGVSIGIAQFPEHARDAESLVEAADRAMYEAKNAGKDTIRVAQAPS